MTKEKTIKTIIVVSLLLIESFVWTVNGPNHSWSLGIIGGADGPTAIFLTDGGKQQMTDEQRKQAEKAADQAAREAKQAAREAEQKKSRDKLIEAAKEKGLLILVNKDHPLKKNYKPDDLEAIKYYASDRLESSRYMRAEAAEAFHNLVEAAEKDHIELRMTTAYRSYDFQKVLYDSYVEKEGQAAADQFSARPGSSEHQTGLAVDVSSPSVDYQLTDEFGKTKEGNWLANHAYQFGFILRYPKEKEDITGYMYEPWHIRYVGFEAAKEIYENHLTLEEFLEGLE